MPIGKKRQDLPANFNVGVGVNTKQGENQHEFSEWVNKAVTKTRYLDEHERMFWSSAHLFIFSGDGCPAASAEHFPPVINEQADVQISGRHKEIQREEEKRTHTRTEKHKALHSYAWSCD